MSGFIPRPYKLFNKIQHYDWGTKNKNAIIPQLLGIKPERDKPYAELWMGAHPKAPSEIEIDGRRVRLDQVVSEHPADLLGCTVSRKFSGKFPFLLKVLSAARALSIQAHPDKSQAERLHSKRPDLYTDDNHKPEIAIAIDSLSAVVGFRPVYDIVNIIRTVPELAELVGGDVVGKLFGTSDNGELATYIRNIYSGIMRESEGNGRLSTCVMKIRDRLLRKGLLTPIEAQFLNQFEIYGVDVGLLSFFFFNLVDMKPGQAIFTEAGVPHAYLQGNIIECMANSDNVVRAGLTGKFKDVETLLEIMTFDFGPCTIINSEQKTGDITYHTRAEEFEVSHFHGEKGSERVSRSNEKPLVHLVLAGSLDVIWSYDGSVHRQGFSKGESFLIPAFLQEFRIGSSSGTEYYAVTVP